METEQTNRVNMFNTVRYYLDEHSSVWSGMAPFQTAIAQFKAEVSAIEAAVQKQETPTGAGAAKAAARQALEAVLFISCEALAVLGHRDNDYELLALARMRPSTLQRLREEALSARAAVVLEAATTRKTALATLQFTQANLDDLDQALQDLNEQKTGPGQAAAERGAQTKLLPGMIRNADGTLRNEIDRMVNLFRRSHPEFVAGYRAARVIIDRAATQKRKKAASNSPETKE
jgi:hypothetical protein